MAENHLTGLVGTKYRRRSPHRTLIFPGRPGNEPVPGNPGVSTELGTDAIDQAPLRRSSGRCVMATARLPDVPPAELRHDSGNNVQRVDYYLRTDLRLSTGHAARLWSGRPGRRAPII